MVLHGIAYLSTYTMDKKCTNVIVLTCFPLFTDWYLNLQELCVDLYLRLQNKLPKRFRLQKKRKSHTLPGQCYSLSYTADQQSRGLTWQLAQGQTSALWLWVALMEILRIPVQHSHIPENQQYHTNIYIHSKYYPGQCVCTGSTVLEPLEISTRKTDLGKQNKWTNKTTFCCCCHFVLFVFISQGLFVFFLFLVCVFPGVLSFSSFVSATEHLGFNSLQYVITSIDILLSVTEKYPARTHRSCLCMRNFRILVFQGTNSYHEK